MKLRLMVELDIDERVLPLNTDSGLSGFVYDLTHPDGTYVTETATNGYTLAKMRICESKEKVKELIKSKVKS